MQKDRVDVFTVHLVFAILLASILLIKYTLYYTASSTVHGLTEQRIGASLSHLLIWALLYNVCLRARPKLLFGTLATVSICAAVLNAPLWGWLGAGLLYVLHNRYSKDDEASEISANSMETLASDHNNVNDFISQIPNIAKKHSENCKHLFDAVLDYSPPSIEILDELVDISWEDNPSKMHPLTILFGDVLGEQIISINDSKNFRDLFSLELSNLVGNTHPPEDSLERYSLIAIERFDLVTLFLGSYFGETIRRIHGGRWTYSEDGEFYLDKVGKEEGHNSIAVYPFLRAKKRFEEDSEESFASYYRALIDFIDKKDY